MASPLAALIVKVLADTAELVTGMKQATASVQGVEKETAAVNSKLSGMASMAKAAGTALAGAFALEKIIAWTKSVVDAAASLDKLATRLDDTVTNVQALERVANIGDTSVDALGHAIQFLQSALANGSAAKGLEALNLSIAQMQTLSPVDQYLAVAAALGEVGDRGAQLVIAQQLLGKSSKELASTWLTDLPTSAKSFITASEESTAALADLDKSFGQGWTTIKNLSIEFLAIASGAKAGAAGLREYNEELDRFAARPGNSEIGNVGNINLPGAAERPRAERPDLPGNTGASVSDLNAAYTSNLAEQQKYLQGQVTDLALVADAWQSVWDRVKEVSAEMANQNTLAAMAINDTILKNQLVAQEAKGRGASTFDRMQTAGGLVTGGTDQIGDILARAQGEAASLGGNEAMQGSALADIYQAANIEIAAVNQGLGSVVESTGAATGEASKLADTFERAQQAAKSIGDGMMTVQAGVSREDYQKMAEGGRVYGGPSDEAGRPDYSRIQFADEMRGGVTNNVQISGVVAGSEHAVQQIVDRAITEAMRNSRRAPAG